MKPLLSVNNLTHLTRRAKASATSLSSCGRARCRDWSVNPARVKPPCRSPSPRLAPQNGEILRGRLPYGMSEAERRRLAAAHRMGRGTSASAGRAASSGLGGRHIGERLMATGARHYGNIRETAQRWLTDVGDPRLAHRRFAHHLLRRHAAAPADRLHPVTHPKLVFMDEPHRG